MLGLPQANSSLFEPVALVYLSRQHRKSVMTSMLGLSERVELMAIHGGIENNYEHNEVLINLPLCPKAADDVNVIALIHELQIFRNSCLHISRYFLSEN